jgi:hypothetical protein
MTEFIVGNHYIYKDTTGLVTYLGESKRPIVGRFKSDSGNVYHYEYESVTPCTNPEPKYPNPPLPHCEERIAFAKGANIESSRKDRVKWGDDLNPTWSDYRAYRVKVEKTKDELRIEELYERVQILMSELNDLNEEIAELEKIND